MVEPIKAPVYYDHVLITGCRFEIGQGLCRILKMTHTAAFVIGADSSSNHAGAVVFDAIEQTPQCDDPAYFDSIRLLCQRHRIDLIIPMSEAEIELFAAHQFTSTFDGIPVLLPNEQAIFVGQDKLATIEFFAQQDIPHPWTRAVESDDPLEVPCIIKPRDGNESKGVLIVSDAGMVPALRRSRPDHIWQELLTPESEEYTCGLFRSFSGEFRSISLRRRLQGGYTSDGVVVHNDEINMYLRRIAESLQLRGAINVQLKLTDNGPVAFEINPRFSSTVVFRHLLGFQDFVWSLMDIRGLVPADYYPAPAGLRFYRDPQEHIVG